MSSNPSVNHVHNSATADTPNASTTAINNNNTANNIHTTQPAPTAEHPITVPPHNASPPPSPSRQAASPPQKVIIVGAGVSGLACAQHLMSSPRNLEVIVLEARARVGGRVFTHWFEGTDPLAPTAAQDVPPNSSTVDPSSIDPPTHPTSPFLNNSTSIPYSNNPFANGNFQFNHKQNAPPPVNPSDATQNPSVQHSQAASPNAPPFRHPFSDLVHGTVTPSRVHPNGTPRLSVDIGASIMHGCGDDNQLVFQRAIEEGIRAPIVAGGGFYESTEHAIWYNDEDGTRIPYESIVEVHNVFFMASRYMAAVASRSDDGGANMESMFNCGVEYVCTQLKRELTSAEEAVLRKISARSVGYCAPMTEMALMQASAGMEAAGADAIVGVPYEEDDPPFPGEVPCMTGASIKAQATRLEKCVISTQNPPRHTIASRRGGPGDRLVLDGYTPFLIDKLKEGVDVRTGKSVCAISKALRAPEHAPPPDPPDVGARGLRARKRLRAEGGGDGEWERDGEGGMRTILVSTRCGYIYSADFVVVTVPLGVLQSNHEESGISFSPGLSEGKMDAIEHMGMGVHNKIVLRFNAEDVFWAEHLPQMNCLDARFQFFNLHSYGKVGVILVHVFAESGFASGYWEYSDEGVLVDVLMVLGGMFCQQSDGDGEAKLEARREALKSRLCGILRICVDCRKTLEVELNTKGVNEGGGSYEACKGCGAAVGEAWKDGSKEGEVEKGLEVVGDIVMGNRKVSWENFPMPEEYVVTRWDADPFALGSYSFMPCGSNWTMIDEIAMAEPRDSAYPYLFFAGEHCSDLGWQCVHGAFETGIRAAKEILGCVDGEFANVQMGGLEVGDGEDEVIDGGEGEVVPVNEDGGEGENENDVVMEEGDDIKDEDENVEQVKEVEPENGEAGNEGVDKIGKLKIDNANRHEFWSTERERALTRALIGYSDVYGNMDDVIDEMSFALESFKKEPTELGRDVIRQLVGERIMERATREDDMEAKVFLKFHNHAAGGGGSGKKKEDMFPKPFQAVEGRGRLIGLNGSKLKQKYAGDIVDELKRYAPEVLENRISYRETLRKIALMIYKKDGGLMTKRCLSEYLRTQEFGTGPQKELYLEKYLASRGDPSGNITGGTSGNNNDNINNN